MPTKLRDPRFLPVKTSYTVPFWYLEQLQARANAQGITVNALVRQALEQVVKPIEPPK